jgi:hypothetical protein
VCVAATSIGVGDRRRQVHHYQRAGYPLTKAQKARLQRLQARLVIAKAHEAEIAAIWKRFRVKELNAAANVYSRNLPTLADRIARTPSKDRFDMIAKARIIEIDPDVDEVCAGIGESNRTGLRPPVRARGSLMTITRTLVSEAASLATLDLFLSTVAIWSAIICGA